MCDRIWMCVNLLTTFDLNDLHLQAYMVGMGKKKYVLVFSSNNLWQLFVIIYTSCESV